MIARAEALARIRNHKPGEALSLCGVDLRGVHLYGVDLRRADLYRSNLTGADLHGAHLRGANLRGANLYRSNLTGACWGGLWIDGLPSGQVTFKPTPDGWHLHVGCWGHPKSGTTADLRALVAGEDWPGARTLEERDHRRPGLLALADLCDAHAAAHPDTIRDLAERWGTDAETAR